ncbi:hypothetical protein [Nannocystis pusilla]|uniref:hypothetical protein n=1 Tax=Nannocystis pusilla TaxID=889268 RepID=UPI003BF3D87B
MSVVHDAATARHGASQDHLDGAENRGVRRPAVPAPERRFEASEISHRIALA